QRARGCVVRPSRVGTSRAAIRWSRHTQAPSRAPRGRRDRPAAPRSSPRAASTAGSGSLPPLSDSLGRNPIPDRWSLVPGPWSQNTQYPTPDTRCPLPTPTYPVPSTRYLFSPLPLTPRPDRPHKELHDLDRRTDAVLGLAPTVAFVGKDHR